MRLALATLVVCAATPALAQSATPAAQLAESQRRFVEGDYQRAVDLTGALLAKSLQGPDLAEAYRLHGLSLFLLGHQAEAETALHELLKLQPDAHLDPALVPPDAIAFLESIRSRYEAELRDLRPKPKKRRSRWLNLVPFGVGQFQNGSAWKGWTFALSEGVLAATAISTYGVLVSQCHEDLTCSLKHSTAENLRYANWLSIGLLGAVYAVGVIDGFTDYNRLEAAESVPITLVPEEGGASLVWVMGF